MSNTPVTICNAGPAIALGKLNRLGLLADLYSEVLLPAPVYHEAVVQGALRGEPDARLIRLFWQKMGWPVVPVSDALLGKVTLSLVLGVGEHSVLALATRYATVEVLLDDAAARAEARRLGIQVRGTLGVLVQAYRRQLITRLEIELLFQEIAERPDIWISAHLCRVVLDGLEDSRRR